jgi:hypothetical protein
VEFRRDDETTALITGWPSGNHASGDRSEFGNANLFVGGFRSSLRAGMPGKGERCDSSSQNDQDHEFHK